MDLDKITPDQNRKLWATARELSMEESELRNLVEKVTGSRSISKLTKGQACRVIDRLEGKASKKKKPRRKEKGILKNESVIVLVTPEQLGFIENLRKEAKWEESHLMNFIKKMWNRDNVKKLRHVEAGVMINVLKRAKEKQKEARA